MGMLAATSAMRRVRDQWRSEKPADYSGLDVMGLPPRTAGPGKLLTSWNVIAILFAAGWLMVLLMMAA